MADESKSETVEGKSVADVRKRFMAQCVDAVMTSAKNFDAASRNQEGRKQPKIDKNAWNGDVFDLIGMKKPFDRKENADDVKNAIKDAAKPGVTGDLMVSGLQGDRLSCVERAFRLAHSTRIRRTLHAAARHRAVGHDAGPVKRGTLRYLRQMLKQSKENG